MKQSIRQFLAKPLIIAMLTAPLSISAYAHEPPSILDFAIKAKSATPSNATKSDAEDIVDNFFDIELRRNRVIHCVRCDTIRSNTIQCRFSNGFKRNTFQCRTSTFPANRRIFSQCL